MFTNPAPPGLKWAASRPLTTSGGAVKIEAIEQAVALLHARSQHELAEAVQSAHRQSGYQTALRTWLDAVEERATKEYVSPLRIAILAMREGNMDKAFPWLNRAVEDRNAGLVYLTVDPKYARLRSDPRFAELAAHVGLKAIQ